MYSVCKVRDNTSPFKRSPFTENNPEAADPGKGQQRIRRFATQYIVSQAILLSLVPVPENH